MLLTYLCLDRLKLQLAQITKVIPPCHIDRAQFMLDRVVDPELQLDWLQQEQVLAHLILLQAYCLVEKTFDVRDSDSTIS